MVCLGAVCLGAVTLEATSAPASAAVQDLAHSGGFFFGDGVDREFVHGVGDPGLLDVAHHRAISLGVRDASSEEEEERDDHFAPGDVFVNEDECPEPALLRAIDECEGLEPSSIRVRLDARGPPAR